MEGFVDIPDTPDKHDSMVVPNMPRFAKMDSPDTPDKPDHSMQFSDSPGLVLQSDFESRSSSNSSGRSSFNVIIIVMYVLIVIYALAGCAHFLDTKLYGARSRKVQNKDVYTNLATN